MVLISVNDGVSRSIITMDTQDIIPLLMKTSGNNCRFDGKNYNISFVLTDFAYWAINELKSILTRNKYPYLENSVLFHRLYVNHVIDYYELEKNITVLRDAAEISAPELVGLLDCFLVDDSHDMALLVVLNSIVLISQYVRLSDGYWKNKKTTNDDIWKFFGDELCLRIDALIDIHGA